jgi:hypothetical protein
MSPKARTTARLAISRKFTPSNIEAAMTGIAMKQIRAFDVVYQRRGRLFNVCISVLLPNAQFKTNSVMRGAPQWNLPATALQPAR